jgi:CheY-like chemotaxis protein
MKTILLIEDSDDIRETTAELLELANYQVLTAENGKIGIEMALRQKPDLVICDIMMPVLDGYGVLHIFGQNPQLQHIPFIFLTAKTERSDLRKGMEMGADDYLTKPFQEIELLNAIESRLRRIAQRTVEQLDQLYQQANMPAQLTSLSDNRKPVIYSKKQLIYAEGDEPSKFYFLKKGKVKTYHLNRDGKEFVTGLYNTGDFFGYLAIVEHTDYKDSATALEEAEVVPIPKHDFLELIAHNQTVAQDFIKILVNNIQEKEVQLASMAYHSLRKRTAESLLYLWKKYKTDDTEGFAIRISRDDLAAIVGTATESLIRTLSDFKTEQLIAIQGSEIRLLNIAKLASIRS